MRRWPAPPRSVPAEEQVRPPRLVLLVRHVRAEQGVDVAARLERGPDQAQARLLGRLPALAVVAGLAGSDEVLPRVAAAAVARQDMIERQVVRAGAAVLAEMPVAQEDLAPGQLHARSRPADLVLEPDHRRRAIRPARRADLLVV